MALKKVSGAKLIITCHDVNPHEIIKGELKYRQLIFNTGDYLLVHNDNSINDLTVNFLTKKEKIIIHPFPIMDISKLIASSDLFNPCDFLFIGHLRKDKGIEFLLDVWKDFYTLHSSAKLCVCEENNLMFQSMK